jgi:hypothetical protein
MTEKKWETEWQTDSKLYDSFLEENKKYENLFETKDSEIKPEYLLHFPIDEELEDADFANPELNIKICLFRISTSINDSSFLEYFFQKNKMKKEWHFPKYLYKVLPKNVQIKTDDEKAENENVNVKNVLMEFICELFEINAEQIINVNDDNKLPVLRGFHKDLEQKQIIAFFDMSHLIGYYNNKPDHWKIPSEITEHPKDGIQWKKDECDFFNNNPQLKYLFDPEENEKIVAPIILWHSAECLTRTEHPLFGFFFIFTKTENATQKFPFVVFEENFDETLFILKKELQNIAKPILEKYKDKFAKKRAISWKESGTEYILMKDLLLIEPFRRPISGDF